jgi:uncharacterized protein YjiS (DUF1127 family)
MRNYAIHQAEVSGSLPGTGILARLYRNWKARRAVAKLGQLDDYLLYDIGVSREDIFIASHLPLTLNAALALDEESRKHVHRSAQKLSVKKLTDNTAVLLSPVRVS